MQLTQWWNFFYLCGSAAAALMGLTFVAVSLGKNLIKKDNLPQVNVFLSPFFFHYLHVFLICALTAIPNMDATFLGVAVIASALWRLVRIPQSVFVIKTLLRKSDGTKSEIDASDWLIIVVLPTCVYVSLIISGIAYIENASFATAELALTCLVLLVATTRGAWDMFIWIVAGLPETPS